VDVKYTTLENTELLCHASVFLAASKYARACFGWQEPQRDHMNSLKVNKEINAL
jgi:hypothetical protein